MSKLLLHCPTCNKKTTTKSRKKKVTKEGIERFFYECQRCGKTETIYYSDMELRNVILQQQEKYDSKRETEILSRMSELKQKYE